MAGRARGAERRGPTRRGARFSQRGLESGVEHHALVIRHGDLALLDAPAIICRSWHPSEDPNLEGEELELEIALHERGWRMCECYSRFVPEGEFGHIAQTRLLAIPG